jgi:hypothetical protein
MLAAMTTGESALRIGATRRPGLAATGAQQRQVEVSCSAHRLEDKLLFSHGSLLATRNEPRCGTGERKKKTVLGHFGFSDHFFVISEPAGENFRHFAAVSSVSVGLPETA